MTEGASTLSGRAAPARSGGGRAALASEPHVSSGLLRALLHFTASQGASLSAAHRALGAHEARLADPDHRVPASVYDATFAACSQAVGTADFGVRLGAEARAAQLGVLGFLLLSSPTLGAALEAYALYQRALGETLQLRLAERGAAASLSILPMHGDAANAHRVESLAAAVHVLAQELCGRPLPWRAATLEHVAAGRPAAALAKLLGVPVSKGPNRLLFGIDALQWPVKHAGADAPLANAMRDHLARRTQRDPTHGLTEEVGATLRRRLAARQRPSLAAVARELGLGSRTLQLRLQEEGQTFRGLCEAVYEQAASAFLKQGSSATEVAHLLGFAEEAAFFRAFKRWTGLTPAQARSLPADA